MIKAERDGQNLAVQNVTIEIAWMTTVTSPHVLMLSRGWAGASVLACELAVAVQGGPADQPLHA